MARQKAHLTDDEVHRFHTARVARQRQLDIHLRSFYGPLPNGECEAVLYDLDGAPAERRGAILAELKRGGVTHRAAVHSYNLSDPDREALEARGVLVLAGLDDGAIAEFFDA